MLHASAFFSSFKYSLRIFAAVTKSHGDGNGNPLFLTGLLQPWQTKKSFQFHGRFCEENFSKMREKVFRDTN